MSQRTLIILSRDSQALGVRWQGLFSQHLTAVDKSQAGREVQIQDAESQML